MFSSGPSRNEHDELSNLVHAQTQVIEVQTSSINELIQHTEILGDMVQKANAELLFMKLMLGGLVAEIAGKCADPTSELNNINARVAFVGTQAQIGDDTFDASVSEASQLVQEIAEKYLRLGERNAT